MQVLDDVALQRFRSFEAGVNVILITPHGRAGSVFFQGLFDGHPEVATLPYFFNEYYQFNSSLTLKENISRFCKKNALFFTVFSDYLIDGFEEKKREVYLKDNINEQAFSEVMFSLLCTRTVTSKTFLLAVYFAFYFLKNKPTEELKYILLHLHHYDYSNYFRMHTKEHELVLADFPDLYYLPFFRRDVRLTVMSYWKEMKNFSLIFGYLICLKNSYRAFHLFKKKVKNLKIIELEELHQGGVVYMEQLCDLFSISYSPVLKECTFDGHKWFGRSVNFNKSCTFNSERIEIPSQWNFSMQEYNYNQFIFWVFKNECLEPVTIRKLFQETFYFFVFYLHDASVVFVSHLGPKTEGKSVIISKLKWIKFQSKHIVHFFRFLVGQILWA